MSEYKLVPLDTLKSIHRDLDACQKVIWLAGGFDPAYCEDAQARLKEIDELLAAPAVQGDLMLHGFRVMHLVGSPGVREGERWEIYAPCGSGGVVHEDEVADWVVRKLLDALAAPQPTQQRCEYCDGTGDVHSIDGEWRGACDCQQPAPNAVETDPKDLIVQLWSSSVRSQWDYSLERGVKITHVPSGITVTCDTERSMYANKNKALCDLQSQLAANPASDVDVLVETLEAVIDYLPIGSPARGLGLSTLAAHRKGGGV